MMYKISKEGEKAVVQLFDRLNTTTSSEFEEAIKPLVKKVKELIFDCSKLDFVSSAGLRVILRTHQKMNEKGKLVVRNPNEEISEIFCITGFEDILNIERDTV